MKSAVFYARFEAGFNARPLPRGLKKMGGRTPNWKLPLQEGALQFKLATNSKASGLLDAHQWPGEFRLRVYWTGGRGSYREEHYVSLFQYTTDDEVEKFTFILRGALQKYLAAGGPDPHGTLKEALTDDIVVPKPNVDTFYYYFDEDDAVAWGQWYGGVIGPWVSRFIESPEANEEWAWRVLWPDLKRPGD